MRKLTVLTLAMIVTVVLGGVAQADEIVVDPNGSADFTTIAAAINAAVAGDVVIVRQGRYFENINMSGKAITLRSTDPTNPAVVTSTIIDGGAAGTVITCDSGEDPNTVISGFVITNGSAWDGGGMYNKSSSPTVSNCTFSENTANSGGGMYNRNYSSPAVSNCTFSGNTANRFGGGMFNLFFSSPAVSNCTFSGNTASDAGGGMFNYSLSSPAVSNCTFSGNTANSNGGGGMYNYNYSSPAVSNCTFSGNTTSDGGGMYNLTFSSPAVSNCTFSENTANSDGGGMYNDDNSSPTVSNCTFSSNMATNGGGMYNNYSSPTVKDSYFCFNSQNTISGDPLHADSEGNNFDFCPPPRPIAPECEGDSDGDGDGILDGIDLSCPPEADWKNHGEYLNCVIHTAEEYLETGLITKEEKNAIISAAAQSDVGKKEN